MSTLRSFLLLLPMAAFLAGCPIYGGDGDDDDDDIRPCVGLGCYCDRDSDCTADGAICNASDHECVAGCRSNADCDSGEICDTATSMCRARPAMCRTHGDCARGQYCEASTCTPSDTCDDDSDCDSGFLCDFRDTCVPREAGRCRTTADCSSGQVCVEGGCRAQDDTCTFNYECGAGRGCVNNHCSEICGTSSEGCPSGTTCQRGFCQPNAECTSSSQCGSDEHCVDGRCFADCRGSETCDSAKEHCSDDDFCRPNWQGQAFCEDDGDCAMGHVCREGVCRTPCTAAGGNDECRRADSQLPVCASDNLCYATGEMNPECTSQSACGAEESCIDAVCR